jgi:hypothetical protein
MVRFLGVSKAIERPNRGGQTGKRGTKNKLAYYDALWEKDDSCMDEISEYFDGSRRQNHDSNSQEEWDRDTWAVKQAERLVAEGDLSRACSKLKSDDTIVIPDRDGAQRLQLKFPPASIPICELTPPPDDTPVFSISIGDLRSRLQSFDSGAAGGRSGLRIHHISLLAEHNDAVAALVPIVTAIINGQLPRWCHPYLAAHKLLALGE